MRKMLIVGTILLMITLLLGGVYFPDFPLMWLAGTSLGFEITRAGLVAVLGILLFSNPPRALYFRYAVGAIALGLAITTIALTMTYEINAIDTMAFMEIAVIFGIEALEMPEEYPDILQAQKTRALAK